MGCFCSELQIVSETEVFAKPAMQIISPASTLSTGTLFVPSKCINLVSLPCSIILPVRSKERTCSFIFAVPCTTFPVRHLPRNWSESSNVASIAKGAFKSCFGGGTCSKIKFNNGSNEERSFSRSVTHHPSRPDAYKIGNSSCCSFASRATNKSNTSSTTSSGRPSGLSTLFIITIGLKPRASALPKTNFV